MRLLPLGTLFTIVALGTASEATARASFRGIGMLEGTDFRASIAYAVSADGTVVVGQAASSDAGVAFRWSETEGGVALGDLPGGDFNSTARAVSADGSVIVGHGSSESGTEAFRWTESSGIVGLVLPTLGTARLRALGFDSDPGRASGHVCRWIASRRYD